MRPTKPPARELSAHLTAQVTRPGNQNLVPVTRANLLKRAPCLGHSFVQRKKSFLPGGGRVFLTGGHQIPVRNRKHCESHMPLLCGEDRLALIFLLDAIPSRRRPTLDRV